MRPRLLIGAAVLGLASGLSGHAGAAGTITIDRFSLTPARLTPGASFELAVEASARDVDTVNFVVRTSAPVADKSVPSGFTYYSKNRRLAYVQENNQVYLLDNGPHDLDPARRAFRMHISTQGWPVGRYDLVVFAVNRPGRNSFVSYGRPGAAVMFSDDEGKTWTDHTVVDATPYSGYTTIVQTGPNEILMAFGTKDYIDPRTGKRSDSVRLATVHYRRLPTR